MRYVVKMINPFDEKDVLVSQVFPTKRRAQTALDKSLAPRPPIRAASRREDA